MPIPNDNDGDAAVARQLKKMPGFKNTVFEVINTSNGARTIYDGVTQAKIIQN